MKRLIAPIVVLAGVLPATAAAAPVRECGNYGYHDGRQQWTYEPLTGAGTYNVTSRVVGCRTARRLALHASSRAGNDRTWRYRRWRCRYVSRAYEYADVRCTRAGGRVVRWQFGA